MVVDNGDCWSCIYDSKYRWIAGLKRFMEFYGVRPYWFMVVNYFGGMKFGVNIFSPKCVEILYPKLLPAHVKSNTNDFIEAKGFDGRDIIDEKSGALLSFNMGSGSCNFFSFVVQSSHLNEDVGKVVCLCCS